jgi:hypothetical protein
MTLQIHPGVVMKPAAVAEWSAVGTAIALQGKQWPADHWKELVRLWAAGVPPRSLEKLFEGKGYNAEDVETMRALLFQNPFILPPIERALFVLGGLAARDDDLPGGFRIHRSPVQALDIIFAANRVLCALALPPIRYPSAGAG